MLLKYSLDKNMADKSGESKPDSTRSWDLFYLSSKLNMLYGGLRSYLSHGRFLSIGRRDDVESQSLSSGLEKARQIAGAHGSISPCQVETTG